MKKIIYIALCIIGGGMLGTSCRTGRTDSQSGECNEFLFNSFRNDSYG